MNGHAGRTAQGAVVVRANGDDPDQIARLVEWLRQRHAHFGDWTIKPAPLFLTASSRSTYLTMTWTTMATRRTLTRSDKARWHNW